jgi:hypothetical protein
MATTHDFSSSPKCSDRREMANRMTRPVCAVHQCVVKAFIGKLAAAAHLLHCSTSRSRANATTARLPKQYNSPIIVLKSRRRDFCRTIQEHPAVIPAQRSARLTGIPARAIVRTMRPVAHFPAILASKSGETTRAAHRPGKSQPHTFNK